MEPLVEPLAPFEPEPEQVPEPFLVEMESPDLIPPAATPPAPFEVVPEPEAAPAPDEIEVALYDVAEEPATVGFPETPAAEEPAFDLPVGEPVEPATAPILAVEEVAVEEASAVPFPEMDEPVPVGETEAAPWDEGPAVEIPPPPPELSGRRRKTSDGHRAHHPRSSTPTSRRSRRPDG